MILNLGPVNTSSTPTNDRAQARADLKLFTDKTKCSFGQYRGRPLGDVPDSYLRWLWQAGKKDEDGPLVDYIRQRLRIPVPAAKQYVDPFKKYYFAVLRDEPLDPRWAEIFQFQDNPDIPY